MNAPNSKRKEISQFLAENASRPFRHMGICSVQPMGEIFDVHLFKIDQYLHINLSLRIIALNAIDYAIRPQDPNIIEGGRELKFSTDDPRLDDPRLQFVPGGDGERFNPPRRYQLLELDQSWIIAQRFEVEELLRRTWSFHMQGQKQSGGDIEASIKERGRK
jgi:hypothetical protein